MKKHLIAAAVAAAVAVPAMAQVTVYGVLDASYTSSSKAGDDFTRQSVNSSLLSTSRLGFRGEEDLGGGLKAGFVLETGIRNDSEMDNSSTTETFKMGDRGAELFLTGGFGQARIGKAATSDANAICSGPTNLTNFTTCATPTRPDNRVQYISPNMSGFVVNAAIATNANANETATKATKDEGKYTNFGVSYVSGPLSLRAFRASIDVDAAGNNADGENKDTGFAVSYNFGVATAQVRYIKTKSSGDSADVDRKTTALDIGVPLGNGLSLGLGYMDIEVDSVATPAIDGDSSRTVLTLVKDLSKRTNIYAAYARASNDDNVSVAASGAATAVKGDNPTMFGVGIRHSF
jgi:predicted porin